MSDKLALLPDGQVTRSTGFITIGEPLVEVDVTGMTNMQVIEEIEDMQKNAKKVTMLSKRQNGRSTKWQEN